MIFCLLLDSRASLHTVNQTSTVLHTQGNKGLCCLPFIPPIITPSLFVTSSLHPSSDPSVLPELCWEHTCAEAEKKPQHCADFISHNPPTLAPAVSSHPALCHFLFSAFLQLLSYFSFLSLSTVPTALTHTDSCTVLGDDYVWQGHCTMSSVILSLRITHGRLYTYKHGFVRLRADTLRKWNLILKRGAVTDGQIHFLKIQLSFISFSYW